MHSRRDRVVARADPHVGADADLQRGPRLPVARLELPEVRVRAPDLVPEPVTNDDADARLVDALEEEDADADRGVSAGEQRPRRLPRGVEQLHLAN